MEIQHHAKSSLTQKGVKSAKVKALVGIDGGVKLCSDTSEKELRFG
jgi:hypothetical protein